MPSRSALVQTSFSLALVLAFALWPRPVRAAWGAQSVASATAGSSGTLDTEVALRAGWLKLLHYRRRFLGGYRSQVQGEAFFLSEDGKTSPLSELQATRHRFLDGSQSMRQKYQCAFLARRDFLLQNKLVDSGEVLPCPEFDQWIAKLNPERISLVFASGTLQEPASSFGHVFLKIHSPKNAGGQDLLDYGINYAARTGKIEGALYALYGLFGYFPGNYGMAPYHHLIKEYTNLEGRDLWEFELSFTAAEVTTIMKHLLELERGYFDYYFLDDNCALMIATVLNVARPELDISHFSKPWTLPLDTVRKMDHEKHLILKEHYRPSLQSQYKSSVESLSWRERWRLRKFLRELGGSTEQNLSAIQMPSSPRLLDAAQNYFSVHTGQDAARNRAINYQLALARSTSTNEDQQRLSEEKTPVSPVRASGASMLAVGWPVGSAPYPSANSRADSSLALLSARGVGYDLLDSSVATAEFGEFKIVDFTIGLTRSKQFALRNVELLHLLNTRAVTLLEAPLSFGFSLDYAQRWQLPVQVGYAVDLPVLGGLRWMIFATSQMQEGGNGQPVLQAGAKSMGVIEVSKQVKALVSYETSLTLQKNESERKFALAWQVARDIQVRFERGKTTEASLRYFF